MDTQIIIWLVVGGIVLAIISFFLGWLLAKIIIGRRNKKLIKEFKEVLEGKRENFIEVEGVKYYAEKFRLKDENGHEVLVDLKGGVLKEDADKEDIKEEGQGETLRQSDTPPRKNSRSTGKKKRNIRRRYG